jgi:diguanylate cyclase
MLKLKKNNIGMFPDDMEMIFSSATKQTIKEDLSKVLKEAEEWMHHQKMLDRKSYRNTIINTLLSTLYEKSAETEEHAERLKHYCYR